MPGHKSIKMKKAYTLLLLLGISVTGMAQIVVNPKGTKIFVDTSKWRLSGSDIYTKNSGNVGIGTSSPAAQLHTTGSVRLQGIGTNTINTNIVTTDASGNVTTRTLSNLLSGNTLTSLNGLTNSVQTFATGTTGTDFNISSSGAIHTFNLPTASATNRGALSSANWTTFNNKIGAVTATTAAAVITGTGTTATINNAGAFWNANQLQGRNIATTAPTNGQVLTYNNTTANWEPAAAAPVTTTVSNTNTAPNSLSTTVNGITGTAVPIINTVSNTSLVNNLSTTVNGVAGTAVPIINSIANSLSGNNLTTTVNGVASTPISLAAIVPATTNTLGLAGNTLTSTVNGVAATSNAVSSITNTSSANNLTTTINGIAATAVNIINSNALSITGGALTSTVNGVASSAVNILATANNGLTATSGNVLLGGSLTQATTITTSATNTLALPGIQNGISTDSLLVLGTGSVIKKVATQQLLVDARRTSTYSPGSSFATLLYNSVNTNIGTAYNTATGSFVAPTTGLYLVIINNEYKWANNSNAQIVNQILVNGTVDMELAESNLPSGSTNSTISGVNYVNLSAGQTISIAVGGETGTVTPNVGTGQHVLKIIKLQ